MTWLSKAWSWILKLYAVEQDITKVITSKSDEMKIVERAVVDAILLARGQQVNLIELYDGLTAARALYKDRSLFVDAFKHLQD